MKNSLCEVAHFDRSESFDVKIGIERAQVTQKLEVPIFFQGRVEPTHHVHFRYSNAKCFSDRGNNFVNRVFEGVSVTFLRGESAELAREDANVGVIDVTIVNIGGVVAVLLLAHDIRHDSKRVEIIRAVESESISL